MIKRLLFFILSILYMELVYHLAVFGFQPVNPIFVIPTMIMVAGLETLLTGLFEKKVNCILLWVCTGLNFLLYFSQLVYIDIFDQPLLFAAIINAGQAALTDFGQEALAGILRCVGYGALFAMPFGALALLLYNELLPYKKFKGKQWLRSLGYGVLGLLLTILVMLCGYQFKLELYDEYQSFYDPASVISRYGVMAAVQRDWFGWMLPASSSALDNLDSMGGQLSDNVTAQPTEVVPTEDPVDRSPNVLNIDFEQLRANSSRKLVQQLTNYLEASIPSRKNEYTGMFKGYNLIYLTAEGFSPYAVDPTLTPTLYKLTTSGFVADNYYVPLWQTSTSDGEYVNLTGLLPDQQFSMRKTGNNQHPYALPAFFAAEGVKSYAYHNNSLSYYDRYKTHTNLGYDFKAAKSGSLSASKYSSQLFAMENANLWPPSDLDMMKATIPEYIVQERFHVYYMTISGHMDYTFGGNNMSKLHEAEVAHLPYSERGKAYVACNMELDRALEYLINELTAAGKLDNTVIALSADHYPYGLEAWEMEELAGRSLEGSLDLYRNSLILWNAKMDTVHITKPCSAMDLLPTLYNLFGFEYDSRLYAGRDMLSDSEGLVVFANQSFITNTMSYNSQTREAVMSDGSPVNEEVLSQMKTRVKGIFEYSAGVLNENFHSAVKAAQK